MINVNINELRLDEFLLDGFLLEHGENILTIRNEECKPLVEIIYFEETNELLIMNKSRMVWCKKVTDIISIDDSLFLIMYEVIENDCVKTRDMQIANFK